MEEVAVMEEEGRRGADGEVVRGAGGSQDRIELSVRTKSWTWLKSRPRGPDPSVLYSLPISDTCTGQA